MRALGDDDGTLHRAVTAAGRGDQRAWDALVDRHSQAVWDTVRALGFDGPDSADICVLAWLRLADHGVGVLDDAHVRARVCDLAEREALRLKASRQAAVLR